MRGLLLELHALSLVARSYALLVHIYSRREAKNWLRECKQVSSCSRMYPRSTSPTILHSYFCVYGETTLLFPWQHYNVMDSGEVTFLSDFIPEFCMHRLHIYTWHTYTCTWIGLWILCSKLATYSKFLSLCSLHDHNLFIICCNMVWLEVWVILLLSVMHFTTFCCIVQQSACLVPRPLSKTPSKKHVPCQGSGNKTGVILAALKASIFQHIVASFPGLAHSLLAVRNLHRRPGLVHHMMCAAAYANFLLQATNVQGLGTRLSI